MLVSLREVSANVAQVSRTQQSVDHGVEGNIPVRVAGETPRLVRKGEAAHLERNPELEAMGVEANPGAGAHRRSVNRDNRSIPEDGTQDRQISIFGQLPVRGIARDRPNRHPDRCERRRFVGGLAASCPGRIESGQQDAEAGRLGGLRGAQGIARDGGLDQAIAQALEGIGHAQHGDGRSRLPRRVQDRLDERRVHGWTRGIVHQHEGVAGSPRIGQAKEPGMHGRRARLTALDQEASVRSGWQAVTVALDLARWDHHRHARQPRGDEQRVQAPAPDRPTPQLGPQLVSAHPAAASGGD